MIWKPRDYQKTAVNFLLERGSGGLFLDPGLGKTSIMLYLIRTLKLKVLIIAPLRVCYNVWDSEIAKWKDSFSSISTSILHGTSKNSRILEDTKVHLINPDGLAWLFDNPNYKADKYDMLIVDESSLFKHTNTNRFKLLRRHLNDFKRRYILTGTPAPNSLMDLYGQMYLVDQGLTLGKYITHYRNKYFYQKIHNPYEWFLKDNAATDICKDMENKILTMQVADYLDMPDLVNVETKVTLPKVVLREYKVLERDLFLAIKDGSITASNAAVGTIKCRQYASGVVYYTEGEKRLDAVVHTKKFEALEELIGEVQGKPLIVAYQFQHELAELLRRFPGAPHIGSGVSEEKITSYINLWNAGRLKLLFAHPRSMSHGLNLQGVGGGVVWFSLTWSFEEYDQLIRRVWRQGQKEKVFVYHIVATGTIDEVVMEGIGKKNRGQQRLFDGLKALQEKEYPRWKIQLSS